MKLLISTSARSFLPTRAAKSPTAQKKVSPELAKKAAAKRKSAVPGKAVDRTLAQLLKNVEKGKSDLEYAKMYLTQAKAALKKYQKTGSLG